MNPTHFRYSWTSYFGGTFELKRTKLGVKYRFSHYPFELSYNDGWKEIEVSPAHWQQFKEEVLALSDWKPEYAEPEILDGEDWEVFIKYPERSIR